MTEVTYIPVDVIQSFMVDVFRGLGAPEKEAHIRHAWQKVAERRAVTYTI